MKKSREFFMVAELPTARNSRNFVTHTGFGLLFKGQRASEFVFAW